MAKIVGSLKPEDDYTHRLGPEPTFNESMYFNFFDPDQSIGGFIRIGNRANEGRAEVTVTFIGKKAEFDVMLARLQGLSDDHFNCHPDEIGWATVGSLEHYASLLKRITDSAFGEGEYAE